MRPLICEVLWTGVSISVYTGILVPIVSKSITCDVVDDTCDQPSVNYIFEKSVMTMCGLGLGEILGGIGMGIIVDKIGAKKSCFVNMALIAI
jgi:hypothetical protein